MRTRHIFLLGAVALLAASQNFSAIARSYDTASFLSSGFEIKGMGKIFASTPEEEKTARSRFSVIFNTIEAPRELSAVVAPFFGPRANLLAEGPAVNTDDSKSMAEVGDACMPLPAFIGKMKQKGYTRIGEVTLVNSAMTYQKYVGPNNQVKEFGIYEEGTPEAKACEIDANDPEVEFEDPVQNVLYGEEVEPEGTGVPIADLGKDDHPTDQTTKELKGNFPDFALRGMTFEELIRTSPKKVFEPRGFSK